MSPLQSTTAHRRMFREILNMDLSTTGHVDLRNSLPQRKPASAPRP